MAGPNTAHSAYRDMKNLIDGAYSGAPKSTVLSDQGSSLSGDKEFSDNFMSYLRKTSEIMRSGEAASQKAASGHITPDVTFAISHMKQQVDEISAILREMRDAINRITSMTT